MPAPTVTGAPCSRCGGTERYSTTKQCVQCNRTRAAKWRADNPEKHAAHAPAKRRWAVKHGRAYWRAYLPKRYGITTEDVDRMLAEQGGACAICVRPFDDTPRIDHDHDTGAVRGLLCHNCNAALGLMRDEPDNLRRAAAYLEKHRDA